MAGGTVSTHLGLRWWNTRSTHLQGPRFLKTVFEVPMLFAINIILVVLLAARSSQVRQLSASPVVRRFSTDRGYRHEREGE